VITREQVEELASRFGWAYDVDDAEAMRECVAADADYEVEITGGDPIDPLSGGDTIASFVAATRATQTDQRRHVLSNFVTVVATDRSRSMRAYLSLLVSDESGSSLGSTGVYGWEVVVEDGRPCFRRFKLTLDRPF
jgi:hypothetical protein